MMKQIFSQKRVAASWFISYLLILILTVILNVYAFSRIQSSMLKQIDTSNIEVLQNKKQYIDNTQVFMTTLATEVAYDVQLREVIHDTKVNETYLYKLYNIREKINRWRYLQYTPQVMYIYFHNTDYIISTKSNADVKRYFETYYKGTQIGFSDYVELLRGKSYGSFHRIFREGGQGSDFLFTFSVFEEGTSNPLATIAIEMNYEDVINDRNQWDENNFFYILDENGEVFIESEHSPVANLDEMVQIVQSAPEGSNAIHTKDAVILHMNSERNNWKYMYIVNKAQYFEDLDRVRFMMNIILCAYLLIGILFAAVMTVRNHRPVQRLVDKLSEAIHMAKGSARGQDEFQYIDQLVTQIIQENEENHSRNSIQEGVIRDAVLLKLVRNDSSTGFLAGEALDSLGIRFAYDDFILILFYIEDLSGIFFEDNLEKDTKEDYKIAKLIVSNVLGDLFSKKYNATFCDLNGVLACIVNTKEKNPDVSEPIEKAQDFILSNFNIEFMAGVSEPHEYLEGLSLCYAEALECLEYKFLNSNSIIRYQDIRSSSKTGYYFPIEKEFQMISCLKSGEYEKGIDLLNEIFRVNLENDKPSLYIIKCLTYDIVGTISKVMGDMGEVGQQEILEHMNIFERIDRCTTVLSMKNEMIDIFREICETNIKESTGRMESVVEQAKEFIASYYDDPNITGSSIADHFGVNQSYLSSVFKKQTGQGILEYIAKMRINKAMELLNHVDNTVEMVSKKVGYTCVRTFSRTFLKYIGIAPGQYKNKNLSS